MDGGGSDTNYIALPGTSPASTSPPLGQIHWGGGGVFFGLVWLSFSGGGHAAGLWNLLEGGFGGAGAGAEVLP